MLTSLVREKNAFNIINVEYVILENDGKESVMFKPNKRPTTPNDMNITPPFDALVTELIIDGRLIQENLVIAGKDEDWLRNEISAKGIPKLEDVLFAALDSTGRLYISLCTSQPESHGK